MSLIVDPFNFEMNGSLSAHAKQRVKAEIGKLRNGRRVDKHIVVRVGFVDIPPRMQNLVGKRAMVLLKAMGEAGSEVECMIVAVHPAPSIPAVGDDGELQRAITQSEFTVKFNEGPTVDGSNYKVISGRYTSLIRGPY